MRLICLRYLWHLEAASHISNTNYAKKSGEPVMNALLFCHEVEILV